MNDHTQSHRADAPSLDTVHAVLKDRRRRFVVDVIAGRRSPIDLHVLARAIAIRLPNDEGEASDERLDRIAAALHHVDLPTLADADVVEYDAEANVVTPCGVGDIAPFLDAADSLQ